MSTRILLAAIFGCICIGGALLVSNRTPKEAEAPPQPTQQEATTPTTATSTLTLTPPNWQPKPTASTTTDPDLTETDVLTRNLLGAYLSESTQNTYTPEYGDSLVNVATADALTLVYTPRTQADITTTADTSSARVATYKADLQTAIEHVFTLDEYELTIYARATERNNLADFEKIATYAQVYQQAGEQAQAVTAPEDAADIHLKVVNSLYHLAAVLNALAVGFDDPARSLSGVYNFTTVEEAFRQSFMSLETYFILKNVNES